MGAQLISNPLNAFGQPTPQIQGSNPMQNEKNTIALVNAATTDLQYGDVVVVDVTGTLGNTTTTSGDLTVIGVVAQDPFLMSTTRDVVSTSVATMNVVVQGVARVFIGTNTVTTGQPLIASSTARQAFASATPAAGTAFAVSLESSTSKDSASTIRCLIKSF
jgi:hypothetical protein